MIPNPPMRITPAERQSPLWLKLRAHYEQRLTSLDEQNRGYLDQVQTERVRGRIAEVVALLELDHDVPGMTR